MAAFSVERPRLVIVLTLIATLAFAFQLPRITTDTDPKHMLPVTSPVRQYNDQVEKDFALHADVIALGIVNERAVVNRGTLSRIAELTRKVQAMPGVISRDVVSFSTIDDVTAHGGGLTVHPVLDRIPESEADLQALRKALFGNPLFINRIVSPDGTATAIFIPIEPTANGREITDKIETLVRQIPGDDRYLVAGDPVARDTFGSEMFRQMGLFSPIAGLVMCVALWLMFRSLPLIVANMAVAMTSIIWSMGLLIGLGYPVHIVSSMSPVFLMAIATDSVHIFNEFAFRFGEVANKRRAVLDTIAAVGGLREAYVRYAKGPFDLSLGRQIVTWGVSVAIPHRLSARATARFDRRTPSLQRDQGSLGRGPLACGGIPTPGSVRPNQHHTATGLSELEVVTIRGL